MTVILEKPQDELRGDDARVPTNPQPYPAKLGSRHLLNVRKSAQYLNVSESYLNKLRSKGGGPEFFKCGSRVTYDLDDLDHWLTKRRRRSTSDSGGAP
jgi:hypothetical protein